MKFYGLQKMTLLDFPGKIACTVFTGGCNLRCPFCHNARLVTEMNDPDIYEEEEILNFLEKRKGRLDGVAITGGEPLLHPEIKDFIIKVKNMGFAVKLDTNGCYPDRLQDLISSKLVDYVAMDVKNQKAKYAQTVGIHDFDLENVEKSIGILKKGDVEYEFRTTVVRSLHDVEDIALLSEWIQGAKRYFIQNFVDSGNLIGFGMSEVGEDNLKAMLEQAKKFVPSAALRGV